MELILNDIVKKYDGKAILNSISATFKPGCCYLLLGENGAGKSTLAKCIVGDEDYDSGTIQFNNLTQSVADNAALQYQSFDSYQHLKIREVVRLFEKLTNNDLEELYEILGLQTFDHILLKNASGGQRKAVSIFLTFLLNKQIVILDEPFADLDLMKKKQLMHFLQNELHKQGKIIMIISHEVAGFEPLFDYVYILKDGKFVENGTRQELDNKYKNTVLAGIEGIYFEVTGTVLGGRAG
ncbi:ABC transporter ATP-binding protein [Lysinibacillus sp. KU-BSD001]|uniref:ATP-binding cassette domain-containing protein n=1 Tax=Lysinibacillus sp. KU-BSD001 TaxID=3141328 RepID=UPI0036E95F0A